MWDIDNFPGAGNVPWQLLIRARFAHEIDAVLASTVVRQVAAVAPSHVAHAVATAAEEASRSGNRERATAKQRLSAFDAALDFDDWCGTQWPHHWPHPRPRYDDLFDPMTEVVVARALDLVQHGGSEELQKTLGSALAELSPARA